MIAALALALSTQSVGEMKGAARVLIVSAARADDPALTAQRNALAEWRRGAADRDVRTVEIVGDRVTGARDGAAMLRRRYGMPAGSFNVALVGKDGLVARRESVPVLAKELQRTIDAMPMRRAGGR